MTTLAGPANDGPSFQVDQGALTDEEAQAISRQCDEEVGSVDLSGYNEDDLRANFDNNTAQYRCLVEAGFAMTSEMRSWESVLDEFRREGSAGSDPIGLLADDNTYGAALAACPRAPDRWTGQPPG